MVCFTAAVDLASSSEKDLEMHYVFWRARQPTGEEEIDVVSRSNSSGCIHSPDLRGPMEGKRRSSFRGGRLPILSKSKRLNVSEFTPVRTVQQVNSQSLVCSIYASVLFTDF